MIEKDKKNKISATELLHPDFSSVEIKSWICWLLSFFSNNISNEERNIQNNDIQICNTIAWWIRSDQSLSPVRIFATPWITACQASLSITNSQSSLRLTSIKSVMPSNHLILCHLLLLLPSIFPRIKVFSNESVLHIRWPKYWSFSFNISPSNEHQVLISDYKLLS